MPTRAIPALPDYAARLQQHLAELITLSAAEVAQVLPYFEPLALARHHCLVQIGQPVPAEFLVLQGCLKTAAYDAQGNEYIVQFATENWWVSDYEAYLRRTPATLEVRALEPSFVLSLPQERRAHLCAAVPQLHAFFSSKGLRGYVAANNRILSLLRHSAKERYELLLRLYPGLAQRLPKKLLAHYLGVSRETLSRLEKRGPATPGQLG